MDNVWFKIVTKSRALDIQAKLTGREKIPSKLKKCKNKITFLNTTTKFSTEKSSLIEIVNIQKKNVSIIS